MIWRIPLCRGLPYNIIGIVILSGTSVTLAFLLTKVTLAAQIFLGTHTTFFEEYSSSFDLGYSKLQFY